ncbi:DNA-packaging protein [Mesorhizobium wenxiniae]|uniref:DNA-packaging protein n=1 Tax=Mesorhizobium wenxiniae TaxID=2014805 RepID=A0A271KFF3_9HYPH|nr:DNA-packaging protein [Mesorhizobium wenxiniae]PAP94512.1 DNA-packaging protein [Mesorhizobium wenxiniae]
MPAPAGNQFWKARSSHGRKPIFATPDDLWTAASEYFEWVEANPLWEDKVTSFQGANTHEPIAKMRAMTISGLCIFLDIDKTTWFDYAKQKDFSHVTTRVEEIIRTQKFEGASADLLNANIIARDLGLADKSEVTGKDGKDLVPADNTRDLARLIAFALAKGQQASK